MAEHALLQTMCAASCAACKVVNYWPNSHKAGVASGAAVARIVPAEQDRSVGCMEWGWERVEQGERWRSYRGGSSGVAKKFSSRCKEEFIAPPPHLFYVLQ